MAKSAPAKTPLLLGDVLATLEPALAGALRREIVADAARAADLGGALRRLRDGMRAHVFTAGGTTIDLARPIQKFDRKTRLLGFHVLHDWDGIADRVNEDIIPVDVLHYLIDKRGSDAVDRDALAMLLDYYFVHLLALLSVRIWDDGDADANLEALQRLLDAVQGAQGSGQAFVSDAETLMLIATSHYELHERGYAVLLERTRTLNHAHRLRIALGHATSMGCHLRFGFQATYGRDTVNMRDDNVADYPWLLFAVATLMAEYARLQAAGEQGIARDRVVEALINGLSADARALVGAPPSSLAAAEEERRRFVETFHAHRAALLDEFERFRPGDAAYSPLCFFFNFSHNVLKGTVIDALLAGRPWPLPFNALLTSLPEDAALSATRTELAETLMGYARANPHRIRGRLRPVIVYDVASGREAFSVAMRKLRE
jgi:hypothetical protein